MPKEGMDLYLINLPRRPDRREAMERQARRLGLNLTRVDAIDAREADPQELSGRFEKSGPLGEIPKGDQCCFLSHRLAWSRLAQSGAPYAVVLEDDVVLSEQAKAVMQNDGWIPPGIDLIKLEHYGPASQSVLLSNFISIGNGLRLGRMRSRHTGGAAYILSRRGAELLLNIPRFDLPVDHLLFNPNNSKIFARLRPWQLLPTIARQEQENTSDIEGSRVALRKFSLTYARRELIRFGYDLKLLPLQLALLATGKAKFTRVAN
jgi:glycosyl transferase family 25